MTSPDAVPRTFEQAWSDKEREGYSYGADALEQVRFGWELCAEEFARGGPLSSGHAEPAPLARTWSMQTLGHLRSRPVTNGELMRWRSLAWGWLDVETIITDQPGVVGLMVLRLLDLVVRFRDASAKESAAVCDKYLAYLRSRLRESEEAEALQPLPGRAPGAIVTADEINAAIKRGQEDEKP